MPVNNERAFAHIGETKGCTNHDHDIIHELSRRLDALWRYDQYIVNANGLSEVEEFWIKVKAQEQRNIQTLKTLLAQQILENSL
ncbi:hypothetical protein GCM10023155_44740 [Bremerella cremea]